MTEADEQPTITAPATPAKNPKRVEQGRKLAEISKQAKANAAKKRDAAKKLDTPAKLQSEAGGWRNAIALAALVLTGVGAYYGYKTYYAREAAERSCRWDPPPVVVAGEASSGASSGAMREAPLDNLE